MRRAAAAGVIGALLLLAPAVPASGDDSEAEALFAAARTAPQLHEFDATVRVTWPGPDGSGSVDVRVRSRDGVVEVERRLRLDRERMLVRGDGNWVEVWGDAVPAPVAIETSKYDVAVDDGPLIVERPTTVVEVRRDEDGVLVERDAFDDESGLLLSQEQYDVDGELVRAVEFIAFHRVPEPIAGFGDDGTAPARAAPEASGSAPGTIGDGFEFVGAYRVRDAMQLYYSDGVFTVSVFVQDGALDWPALRRAGVSSQRLEGTEAAMAVVPVGTVISWEHDGTVYTCVTDAPAEELPGLVAAFPGRPEPSWVERLADLITVPLRW